MKKPVQLILWIAVSTALIWACDDKFTGYEESTAIARFKSSEIVIPDTVVLPTPIIISLSEFNYRSNYDIYVKVNDNKAYLQNNLLSISNQVLKEANYQNGDSTFIYRVVVAKATSVAAIMVTPQVNTLEKVTHSLHFEIVPDSSNLVQPLGHKFYEVDEKNNRVTVKIQPK